MAYNSIGIPRFYIDIFEHFKSINQSYNEIAFEIDDYDGNFNSDLTSYHSMIYDNNWSETYSDFGTEGNSNLSLKISSDNLYGLDKPYFYSFKRELESFHMCGFGMQTDLNFNSLFGESDNFYMGIFNNNIRGNDTFLDIRINNAAPIISEFILGDKETDANANQVDLHNWYNAIFTLTDIEDANNFCLSFINQGTPINNIQGKALQKSMSTIGNISFGQFYDMTQAVDLNLDIDYINSPYKKLVTTNGSEFNICKTTGSPIWYDSSGNKTYPFQTEKQNYPVNQVDYTHHYNKTRRVWNLSFSYMVDTNLMPANFNSTNYLETKDSYNTSDLTDDTEEFAYNVGTDPSFLTSVINKISYGEKFIFQPDNTKSSPSDFSICVLDSKSFSMKRTAFNVYDIKMKIMEVW